MQSAFKTAYDDIFVNGKNAFSALADAFKAAFIDQVTSMLAASSVNLLFKVFSGGTADAGATSLIGNLFGFASGTPYAPGGTAIVGENGPEVVNLPQGASVQTTQSTNTTNNISNTYNITQAPGEDSQALANRIEDMTRKGYATTGLANYAIAGAY